jgi:hypothetical protein
MFDWIGSLRIQESSQRRVVLGVSSATRLAGLVLLAAGGWAAYRGWSVSPWLAVAPALLALLGAALVSLRRRLVFDRAAGVLEVEQRVLGWGSRAVVPLFHLRAVVIRARAGGGLPWVDRVVAPSRYTAIIERRVGEEIFLDEARRCAYLLRMAEAVAEIAEIRLEYDATSRAGSA